MSEFLGHRRYLIINRFKHSRVNLRNIQSLPSEILKLIHIHHSLSALDAHPVSLGIETNFASPFFPGLVIPTAAVFKPSRLG